MSFFGFAFVDWDDTIAANQIYFNQVEEANAHLIARVTKSDPKAVLERGRALDIATAQRMGLVKESLSSAWLECYHEFCSLQSIEADPDTEEAIRRACRIPYEVRQDLLPGAPQTLAWLHRAGFEVTIWTAGEEAIQSRKIEESGLKRYIHRVVVVPEKSPGRLLAALADRRPDRAFVVGNSLRSDIRPALAVGLMAIHVPAETWAYDHAFLDYEDGNYRVAERITDVPNVLATSFGLAARDECAG